MSEEIIDVERDEDEDSLFEHHRIVADKGQGLVRIDKFLVDRLEKTSRSRIQEAHDAGYVKVNGISVKSSYKVKPNDVITIELPYPVREFEIIPENIPLDIIYEDEDGSVVSISKPAAADTWPELLLTYFYFLRGCSFPLNTKEFVEHFADLLKDWEKAEDDLPYTQRSGSDGC